ncbi:MAG: glycine cleavage system protein GcvH [Limnochordia bacterium]|jgi:glycine cleavage system H protein
MYPADLKYSEEHEWLKLEEGNRAKIGITEFAQKELGDVVFVELPEVGATVAAGDDFAVVESVKAVSDIYAPVSGKVAEVNDALADRPELINEDPYGEGWIAIIEVTDAAEADALLTATQYEELIGE